MHKLVVPFRNRQAPDCSWSGQNSPGTVPDVLSENRGAPASWKQNIALAHFVKATCTPAEVSVPHVSTWRSDQALLRSLLVHLQPYLVTTVAFCQAEALLPPLPLPHSWLLVLSFSWFWTRKKNKEQPILFTCTRPVSVFWDELLWFKGRCKRVWIKR